jgi:SAM-dependent methyltransferase
VLDLACGDGGLADFLPNLRYLGVDASEAMVAAGTSRGRDLVRADLNEYEPPEPVQATTIFRAVYYARDRRELFTRIRSYTERKLVFDLNPRQYRLEDVREDVHAAGFARLDTRPFFVPQTRAVPLLMVLERSGPLARLLLRYRFTVLCAAS